MPGRHCAKLFSIQATAAQDDAVHLLARQNVDVIQFLLGVFVGVTQEDAITLPVRHALYAEHQFGKEWVGDLGDDEGDRRCTTGGQPARDDVGPVTELADCVQNALPRCFGDFALIVDDSRYGLDRDIRLFGDISHGHSQENRLPNLPYSQLRPGTWASNRDG